MLRHVKHHSSPDPDLATLPSYVRRRAPLSQLLLGLAYRFPIRRTVVTNGLQAQESSRQPFTICCTIVRLDTRLRQQCSDCFAQQMTDGAGQKWAARSQVRTFAPSHSRKIG